MSLRPPVSILPYTRCPYTALFRSNASKRETPLKTRSRPRAVVDHHVDRRHVEAQQCVKLSLTNRSIGLIPLASGNGAGNTNIVASSDQFETLPKAKHRPDRHRPEEHQASEASGRTCTHRGDEN